MSNVQFLETPVYHASDFIRWYDATGNADPSLRKNISYPLFIELSSAPKDLFVQQRNGKTCFSRRNLAGNRITLEGRASGSDLIPPVETLYLIEGRVWDSSGIFNPRLFSVTAGNAQGHEIPLYRSAVGSAIRSGGALRATIFYADLTPASWALVTVNVTPPLGAALSFVAQADIHGDVQIPMDRLPPLTLVSPTNSYTAQLSVMANGDSGSEISNPDSFVLFQVADLTAPGSFFNTVNLNVVPGAVASVVSAGEQQLIIQST